MKLNNIKQSTSLWLGRTKFWFKKNSPEILTGAGLILSVASVALAIFQTTKLEKITYHDKKKIVTLKEELKNPENQEAKKKELNKVRFNLAFNVCKLYAPTFISLVLSSACILSSHKIMKGRNLALAAAYATLDNGYRAYRARVAERFGEKVENEIYRGIKKETVVDENGNKVEKEIEAPDVQRRSDWAIIFDESNPNWNDNGVLNLEWLELQERYANQKLKAQGYLFLSDVYKQLGLDDNCIDNVKLQGSHVVGWLYDPKDPTRDSYVSFGIKDRTTGEYTKQAMEMKRYGERNIFVDFNVDGDILTGKFDDNGRPTKTFVTRIREISREK